MKTLLRGRLHGASEADAVLVDGDTIVWVGRGPPPQRPDEEVVAVPGELIAPGFIDLQANGFGAQDPASGSEPIAAIPEARPATRVTASPPTAVSSPATVPARFSPQV